MTAQSIADILKEKGVFIPEVGDKFTMSFKDGADGAGQQVCWKSKSMIDSQANMFQYGITPLQLTCERDGQEEVIWRNDSPNAARTLRPVYLVREVETDEDLLSEVMGKTDSARDELVEEGLVVKFGDTAMYFDIKIIDSMKDLKFKRKISGLGGAD